MATQNFYASGLNPDPGFLAISRGQLEGFRPVFRNGFNPDVDAGGAESVWDQGGLYVFPSTPSVMQVSSSNAADTGAGAGARTVFLAGLDADYNTVSETLTLSGQTQVPSVNTYVRVQALTVLTSGANGGSVGDVYVGIGAAASGVPATVYAKARAGWNASNQIAYTIPAGFTGYVINAFASAQGSGMNQSTVMSLRRRSFGSNVFTRAGSIIVSGQAAEIAGQLYNRFPEKTDIDVVCETDDSNVLVSAQVRLLLVPGVDNPV